MVNYPPNTLNTYFEIQRCLDNAETALSLEGGRELYLIEINRTKKLLMEKRSNLSESEIKGIDSRLCTLSREAKSKGGED